MKKCELCFMLFQRTCGPFFTCQWEAKWDHSESRSAEVFHQLYSQITVKLIFYNNK